MLLAPALGWGQPAPATPSAANGFAVLSEDPGAWPQILGAVGFRPGVAGTAGIFVGRAGTPATTV